MNATVELLSPYEEIHLQAPYTQKARATLHFSHRPYGMTMPDLIIGVTYGYSDPNKGKLARNVKFSVQVKGQFPSQMTLKLNPEPETLIFEFGDTSFLFVLELEAIFEGGAGKTVTNKVDGGISVGNPEKFGVHAGAGREESITARIKSVSVPFLITGKFYARDLQHIYGLHYTLL